MNGDRDAASSGCGGVQPGRDFEAALDRLADAALLWTSDPGGEARRAVERDVATVRAGLAERAAALRMAEAASEAAVDARRGAYPRGPG